MNQEWCSRETGNRRGFPPPCAVAPPGWTALTSAPVVRQRELSAARMGLRHCRGMTSATPTPAPSRPRGLDGSLAMNDANARRRHLTARERADVLERWQAGERAGSIGARYGVSRRWVQELARVAGLPSRLRPLSDGERHVMLRYAADGCSARAIARHVGRSDRTVRRVLAQAQTAARQTATQELS